MAVILNLSSYSRQNKVHGSITLKPWSLGILHMWGVGLCKCDYIKDMGFSWWAPTVITLILVKRRQSEV